MRKQRDTEIFRKTKKKIGKNSILKLRDEIDLANISSVTSLGIM